MITLVIAVVVVINVIVGEMPSNWTAVDFTDQKLYSLTNTTKEFVKTLDEDITIYAIAKEDSQDILIKQTLNRFDDLEHITVEYVDPTVNPGFHQQYTDQAISMNSLIVVGEKRTKVIDGNELYESTFDYDTYTTTTTGYDGEGQITSALAYVTSDDSPMIYVTEGQGENYLSTTFTEGLVKLNADYEIINLMNYEAVPEDASCLLINAPVTDFNEDNKEKIIAYLEKGGNVVVVTAYTDQDMPNFKEILSYMGMEVADGMLVEQNQGYFYQTPLYLLPKINYSVYTADVYGTYYVFAPIATGIQIVDEEAQGLTYNTFLETSEEAFSKTNLTDNEDLVYTQEDIMGPFGIGIEAVKEIVGADGEILEATMIAIGCENFFTDDANMMVSGANQKIFNSIMGSFSEHEVSVSVPVKEYQVSYLMVPQMSMITIAVIVTMVLPIGCLVLGFVIWFRRRKR